MPTEGSQFHPSSCHHSHSYQQICMFHDRYVRRAPRIPYKVGPFSTHMLPYHVPSLPSFFFASTMYQHTCVFYSHVPALALTLHFNFGHFSSYLFFCRPFSSNFQIPFVCPIRPGNFPMSPLRSVFLEPKIHRTSFPFTCALAMPFVVLPSLRH